MSALAAHGFDVALGGQPVLQGVDLRFKAGEVTAIVGPNGAGKSTLLMALAGLSRPDGGEARLDDEPVLSLAPRERARRIAYLPQSPQIAWALEVQAFVRLGRTAYRGLYGESAEDAAAVGRALARTGMTAFAARDITTLSGGERARALIARALAGEPAWLLADEPLTGLDIGHQLDAAALLRDVADDGAGVIVTLHDLPFAARLADRVVVVARGKVIADGAPMEALAAPVLRKAYGLEAGWVTGVGGPLLDVTATTDP
jgi:iron complex transport system ATP-binding protein